MFSYNNNTEIYLYDKRFYLASCFSNAVCFQITKFIIPQMELMMDVFTILFIILLLENAFRHLLKQQYINRYVLKIVVGMCVISTSVYYSSREYIIFLPVLMCLLYLNVNTILKSKTISFLSFPFALVSFGKIFITEKYQSFEYIGVIFIFSTIVILSMLLFKSNKSQFELNEQKAELFKNVNKSMNQLRRHDVRNELMKMMILAKSKYRNDVELFMDTLQSFTTSINELIDDKIYDSHFEVDIDSIISTMNHITSHKSINFKYIKEDSVPLLSNKNFLYSTIKNFVENCCEAAMNKGIVADVVVTKTENKIIIEDSCGGFDVNKIIEGYTSKNEKNLHGVFLKTITNPFIKNMFGFEVKIERVCNGTKVSLIFQEVAI